MLELPTNPDIDMRNQGYYLAGTRISLDSIAHAVNRGETVDEILADFPAIESRQRLEGAVAFIKAYPKEIEAYLAKTAQEWDEARKLNPPDLIKKARRYREGRNDSTLPSACAFLSFSRSQGISRCDTDSAALASEPGR